MLLLAEPFARCDQASSALLSDLIRQQALAGSAVLILASDSANLMGLCSTVYSLEQGRITESYQPQTEQARAQAPFKIPVRMEGRVALVNPADILYAEAEEGRGIFADAGWTPANPVHLNRVWKSAWGAAGSSALTGLTW